MTSGLPFEAISHGGRSLAGGCSSFVWDITICIRNGEVETDALNRFKITAILSHDPFKISLGLSSASLHFPYLCNAK